MLELVPVDRSPYGSRTPGALDRLALSLTRAMPNNWLGLRLAILFRRIVTSRLGRGALDTELWGLRLRLYALGNGCEKNALFTPQMFDVMERMFWRRRSSASAKGFTFVDIGANVGTVFAVRRIARRERAHSRDRAAARHSRPPALQSRGQSRRQSRRAADRAREPRRHGRACPRHQRQRRYAHRNRDASAKQARAYR